MLKPDRFRTSTHCFGVLAYLSAAVLLNAIAPSRARAQDVLVTPHSQNAAGAVAADGSGFVLLASGLQANHYAVVISSANGVSSAVITIGDDGSFATTTQTGSSGFVLATPIAVERDGNIAYVFAITPSGLKGTPSYSSASRGWLDSYAEWFNSTFGDGWSEMAGGVIHDVITVVVSDETLANSSDGALLTGTVIVSTPVAFGIVIGGEIVLGVGTFGGEVAAGGTTATGALAEAEMALGQAQALAAEQSALMAEATTASGLDAAIIEWNLGVLAAEEASYWAYWEFMMAHPD